MSLKIIDKWYVGLSTRGTNGFPLGFMVPDGTDSASKKRKDTVDNWRDKEMPTVELDSTPVSGFKLASLVGRYSRDSNQDKWKVEDPRGFILEITSSNLEHIILNNGMKNQEFDGKYVWLRDGANNRLYSENSPVYTELLSSMEKMKNHTSEKITGSKLVVGTIYKTSQYELLYIGKRYALNKASSYSTVYESSRQNFIAISHKKKPVFTFLYKDYRGNWTPMVYVSCPTISGIIQENAITPAIQKIIDSSYTADSSTYGDYYISSKPIEVTKNTSIFSMADVKEKMIKNDFTLFPKNGIIYCPSNKRIGTWNRSNATHMISHYGRYGYENGNSYNYLNLFITQLDEDFDDLTKNYKGQSIENHMYSWHRTRELTFEKSGQGNIEYITATASIEKEDGSIINVDVFSWDK